LCLIWQSKIGEWRQGGRGGERGEGRGEGRGERGGVEGRGERGEGRRGLYGKKNLIFECTGDTLQQQIILGFSNFATSTDVAHVAQVETLPVQHGYEIVPNTWFYVLDHEIPVPPPSLPPTFSLPPLLSPSPFVLTKLLATSGTTFAYKLSTASLSLSLYSNTLGSSAIQIVKQSEQMGPTPSFWM
jgi:hypothetical protein